MDDWLTPWISQLPPFLGGRRFIYRGLQGVPAFLPDHFIVDGQPDLQRLRNSAASVIPHALWVAFYNHSRHFPNSPNPYRRWHELVRNAPNRIFHAAHFNVSYNQAVSWSGLDQNPIDRPQFSTILRIPTPPGTLFWEDRFRDYEFGIMTNIPAEVLTTSRMDEIVYRISYNGRLYRPDEIRHLWLPEVRLLQRIIEYLVAQPASLPLEAALRAFAELETALADEGQPNASNRE